MRHSICLMFLTFYLTPFAVTLKENVSCGKVFYFNRLLYNLGFLFVSVSTAVFPDSGKTFYWTEPQTPALTCEIQ